jgi:hypothetical protein
MKRTIIIVLVAFVGSLVTSCATSNGCNFSKAQKHNARQFRKGAYAMTACEKSF